MLCRVPAFPDSQLRKSVREGVLTVEGQSTWHLTGGSGCDQEQITMALCPLLVGFQHPISCSLAGFSFRNWASIQGEDQNTQNGNYIAILALCWAYILSARLVEMQRKTEAEPGVEVHDGRMLYTEDVATTKY